MTRLINFGIAAGLLVSAASHGYLFLHGYQYIPAIGPGFLVLTSVSVALAILIALGGPGWLRMAALLVSLGALGAFALSRTIGVMGFIERGWEAPHGPISVLTEAATVVLCAWSLVRRESPVPAGQFE
ncbi:hypothetical protein FHT40_004906 [Mycolicibacterium sp. BK556]|uniref:hypothetical protein n=1 Tax=unclassified Mycolicibacterium TaxID=2636767 RepID=UPI00161EDA9B|nr:MULTISPECIES: hypothetical protein [unclassified Mycolicibacterium]MBB3605222.1 hypothetical protein [Mycolicibacterium sp. BK556]MBB3635418.1 hypothetical protein [Mycolicibacterium sp. BK607]MBB3747788.1 hypothetical protein [Mycolicibacterium sp. BK634]